VSITEHNDLAQGTLIDAADEVAKAVPLLIAAE